MTKNRNDSLPRLNSDVFKTFQKNGEENYAPPPIFTRSNGRGPFYFVLGAEDPEMNEIESILAENGETFEYAKRHGERVKPWNAYEADPVHVPSGTITVLVECEPKRFGGKNGIIPIIDHHRIGDPGYDLPPEQFWRASSIGQLYALLSLGEPKRKHVVLAAMDHCMAQARLGKCPGIDSEEVRALSIEYTALHKGVDIHAVIASVRSMKKKVLDAPLITLGAQRVVDLTSVSIGVGYSLDYLCLLEAIAELGVPALIQTRNSSKDRAKILLHGAATPETVIDFMETYAPAHGISGIYGTPSRGHAGGFLN